jgi:uncharacterized membrane protein YfcA
MVPLGLAVGVVGTLIGAGGGFILAPILLLMYPDKPAHVVTGITLSVATVNALVGTLSYARLGRIDYRAGLAFAAASLPGAVLGALVTSLVHRRTFDVLFGVALLALAAVLLVRTRRGVVRVGGAAGDAGPARDRAWWGRGGGISAGVGFVAALMGVGGGIVHVPALVYVLGFPVHMATATSTFVLGITSGTAAGTHLLTGGLTEGATRAVLLCVGAALGAPLGARLSSRVSGVWIVRVLGGALVLVGARLAWMGLSA